MPDHGEMKSDADQVADLIQDAGGMLIGRTRLQKMAYLLEITGLGSGFYFSYRHYGPYSEQLAVGSRRAHNLGLIQEEEHASSWGGTCSIYRGETSGMRGPSDPARSALIDIMKDAGSIVLELAATAAYLAREGVEDPWADTRRRKPEKAEQGRLEQAKALYARLMEVQAPEKLPIIPEEKNHP